MTKTWLITGISSGFGRELAEQLLARGDRVAGTVRDESTVADLEHAHGDRLRVERLDLAETAMIAPVIARTFREVGPIDVVVNNAGYGLFGPAEGLSDAQVRDQIDTNLIGPIQVTRAALPFLRDRGRGHILAISSYGGQATHPGASLYHASKWGLEGFFESLAQEVAPFGIGVTIVEPGGARTAFRRAAGVRMGAIPPAYQATPLGAMLGRLSDPGYLAKGDPAAMVRAMIACVDHTPELRRLVLGSDAYGFLSKALGERLAAVEAQRDQAAASDAGWRLTSEQFSADEGDEAVCGAPGMGCRQVSIGVPAALQRQIQRAGIQQSREDAGGLPPVLEPPFQVTRPVLQIGREGETVAIEVPEVCRNPLVRACRGGRRAEFGRSALVDTTIRPASQKTASGTRDETNSPLAPDTWSSAAPGALRLGRDLACWLITYLRTARPMATCCS